MLEPRLYTDKQYHHEYYLFHLSNVCKLYYLFLTIGPYIKENFEYERFN